MDGITIIVPCYNSEKYIKKCLNSLISQTFRNIEIIVVDDSSTDNSLKILELYQKEYSIIKILKNKTNRGAGYSRNKAIKHARYSYIGFIDSDDYVDKDYYLEMYNSIDSEQSDVAICDIYIRYDDSDKDVRSKAAERTKEKISYFENGLVASPCNKVFKKESLLKYPFAEGIMNEDVATVLAILNDANKISYNNNVFYNYVQHENSVQNIQLSDKRLDIFKSLNILKQRLSPKFNKEIWDIIVFNQIVTILLYVVPKEKSFIIRGRFLKKYLRLLKPLNFRQNPNTWKFLSEQGKYHKIYYRIMFFLCDYMQTLIINIMISFYHFHGRYIKRSVIKPRITDNDLIRMAKKQQKMTDNGIKLSVVVPNYNYKNFFYQRLYSILYQKRKVQEIIVLDDCSSDGSQEMIERVVSLLKPYIDIKSVPNKQNSGSAFKQWEKGFHLMKGDYLWIAEADDYSDKNFLKYALRPMINDKEVKVSYVDTAFIDKKGFKILRSIVKEIDIMNTGHWSRSYINDGLEEIKNYAFLNCTIANVSSVIFKRGNYDRYFEISRDFKQAGDWMFYINVMQEGKIAYTNKALNYYRLHGSNVTSLTKKVNHFKEIVRIHEYIKFNFKLKDNHEIYIKQRYDFLNRVWDLNIDKEEYNEF